MSAVWIILAVFNSGAWLLHAPTDKLGWALRVRPMVRHQTYFNRESIDHITLALTLVNQSGEKRFSMSLREARDTGDLKISIIPPDADKLDRISFRHLRVPVKSMPIESGKFIQCDFTFIDFGYYELADVGTYELRASLETTRGQIFAPVVKLRVIEPAPSDILESKPVPLEGYKSKWPKEKHDSAAIQQIKIGDRTWLFYRKFLSPLDGGKVSNTFRIAELPGKVVDFKVEGAFGNGNPLTITYREHTYTKWTTTHVINSVDGRPWTAAEEKQRQEELKLEAKPPADKD